jgi:hypothetical protein
MGIAHRAAGHLVVFAIIAVAVAGVLLGLRAAGVVLGDTLRLGVAFGVAFGVGEIARRAVFARL